MLVEALSIKCMLNSKPIFRGTSTIDPGDTPGGGGGAQVQKGAAPALRISRKKGSSLRPSHVRDFVKEGDSFVPRYEVWGVKIPLQSTKYTRLWRRVTPEVTGLPSLLPRLAATKQAEDYTILS